jgi:hypothetical protein
MQASIEDRVKKTDIFTYNNGNISGGNIGNGATASSGGAIGYNA